jgi:uroporphyrinogen-III synthase
MHWANRWRLSCAHKALTKTTLPAMRVIITRPAGDGEAWVDALQVAGHQALALPLIDVGPVRNLQPVQQAWAQWPDFQAVMFVSAQAVRYFFERQPAAMRADAQRVDDVFQASHAAPSAIWANGPRCWATGPGTHKALLQAGVPEACIDSPGADASQFDSEALWQRVRSQVQAGKPVLIVRGQDVDIQPDAAMNGSGRDWLAQQLQAAGASAQFVVAYERRAPVWVAEQKAQASEAAMDGSLWCFSSSQAIENLKLILPTQTWAQTRCVATHPRIAQTAQDLGFGEVQMAKPTLPDLLASLESQA